MAQPDQPTKAIYRPHNGLAAIDPKAVGLEFLLAAPAALPMPEGVACVHVCGPLAFGGFLFATYASIREQVRAALASEAHTVLLVFDSPGGDVDGCFDCARGMRSDADAAGKRLIGWVPSKVCSAAYALSTACDRLYVAASAQVGSIGVIRELQSVTKADAAAGVEYAFIVSGSKKALGNPHMPITDATLTEAQTHVDATAELFFGLVKDTRGFNPEALEAAVFMGDEAVRRKLADEVTTLDALLVQLAARTVQREAGAIQGGSASRISSKDPMAAKADDKKDDTKDDMRASLQKAADGGDAKAVRALKAYDDDGDDKKDDDKAQAKASDDDEKKAKAEFPPKKDDDKALAATSSLAASMLESDRRIKALEAEIAAGKTATAKAEREAFMASCANLPDALRKSFDLLSLEQARAVVAGLPGFTSRAASLAQQPHIGDTSGAATATASADPELNARMGLVEYSHESRLKDGVVQEFGVMTPKVGK